MREIRYRLRQKPTRKSERIVVDELLYDGLVRLLRAKYVGGEAERETGRAVEREAAQVPQSKHTLRIEKWGKEREYVIKGWLVEAFVGYPSDRHLQEGDVFYLKDGSKLNARYQPIERKRARSEHLLVDLEQSAKIARADIKREYSLLNMTHAAAAQGERLQLQQLVNMFVQMPIQSAEPVKE